MGPGRLATQLARLTGAAVQTQWRLAQEYAQASSRVARQGATRATATTATREARDEAARWWREAAELALGYGQALVDLNRETGERLVRTVAAAAGDELRVSVSAVSGGTIREPVTIANTRSSPQHVTFVPGPLRAGDGTAVAAPWAFEPTDLTLQPGEEQRVVMVLPLAEAVFPAGSAWQGTIGVHHEDGTVLPVEVHLDVR